MGRSPVSRKMSAYARRMRRMGGQFNGAEWLNVIQRSRPYSDEPIPGSWLPGTMDTAVRVQLRVREALDLFLRHAVKPGDFEPHDLLAHALGVASIRAEEIGSDDMERNPALAYLAIATRALIAVKARYDRTGVWGLAGVERQALVAGVDVYEEILAASSPAQMEAATAERHRRLQEQNHG